MLGAMWLPAGFSHGLRAAARWLPNPRRTPFTFWYLVLLLLTTLLLEFGKPSSVHRLLMLSSTDAVNLRHNPVQALLLSALWLQDGHWLVYVAIFAVVIAPLERRIGSLRTVAVFAAGHVLASLATELPVLWAVRAHLLPRADGHLLDIGVSYGLFAVAGAVLLVLPGMARWAAIGLLNTSIVAIYVGMGPETTDAVVTAAGHLLALYTGLLAGLPLLRRRGLVGSVRLPSWARIRRIGRGRLADSGHSGPPAQSVGSATPAAVPGTP